MKHRIALALLLLFFVSLSALAQKREYYELRTYFLESAEQEKRLDQYLQSALVPALHRAGFKQVGVFRDITNDTSARREMYLLIPFRKMDQWTGLTAKLEKDQAYQTAGSDYINTNYKTPVYQRIESSVMQAFRSMPQSKTPGLKAPKSERIYELRSYQSPSEKLYANKVHMFDKGGETALFQRLGFNAVFYAEVLSGPRMPNLVYMTSFESRAERDAHWKAFGSDPEWKRISSMPEYQNNMNKADIMLLRATEYSDF